MPRRGSRVLDPEPGDVERREEEQGQGGADDNSAHHGVRHRPPEDLAGDGDQREAGGGGGQQDRAHAVERRVEDCVPRGDTISAKRLHLHDQDDGIAYQDTDQREHPEDRYEPERGAARQ